MRATIGSRNDIEIPEPLFATRRVLVMTYLEGVSLATAFAEQKPIDHTYFHTMIDVTGQQVLHTPICLLFEG